MVVSKYVTGEEFETLRRRVKVLEEMMQVANFITSFDWKEFDERDRRILDSLHKHREGFTTTQIARLVKLDEPERGGRVIVLRRLKKIAQISKRIKGAPIVIRISKIWTLNYDEFSFQITEKREGAFSEEQGFSEEK